MRRGNLVSNLNSQLLTLNSQIPFFAFIFANTAVGRP